MTCLYIGIKLLYYIHTLINTLKLFTDNAILTITVYCKESLSLTTLIFKCHHRHQQNVVCSSFTIITISPNTQSDSSLHESHIPYLFILFFAHVINNSQLTIFSPLINAQYCTKCPDKTEKVLWNINHSYFNMFNHYVSCTEMSFITHELSIFYHTLKNSQFHFIKSLTS